MSLKKLLESFRRSIPYSGRSGSRRKRRFNTWSHTGPQVLEQRILLSGTPIVSELRLNATTHLPQISDSRANQTVAGLPGGGFVSVWESLRQDGSGWGVFGQRFDGTGNRMGAVFQVNQQTRFNQQAPSVDVATDGRSVVAWQSFHQDGSVNAVIARIYNVNGTAATDEFIVNQTTKGIQGNADVGFLNNGNVVVTWNGRGKGDRFGVFARIFNASGSAVTNEFKVSEFTKGLQYDPTVAADSTGGFWLAWSGRGADDRRAIHARRFSSDGTAQGGEFRVNEYSKHVQDRPAIAASADGRLLIGWQSQKQDGSALGVYARLYNVNGTAQGHEFRVNETTKRFQFRPHLAFTSNGGFAVTWMGNGGGDRWGVFVREYNAAGAAETGERLVNVTTKGLQFRPAISGTTDGFVVMWSGRGQGDRRGVFASIYREQSTAVIDLLAIPNQVVDEGQSIIVNPSLATGSVAADHFTLAGTLPSGAVFNSATGRIEWTPGEAHGSGTFNVTITAVGQNGQSDASTFTITVNEVQSAPVLAAIGNKTINEGQLLSFTTTATDPDLPANILRFRLGSGAPAGTAIDPITGLFTWTPTEQQGPSTGSVTIFVDDGTGLSDSETITITANEVQSAPVLAAIGNKTVNESQLLSFNASATDPDLPANTLRFRLGSGAPAGTAIDPITGLFTWTPTEQQGPSTGNVTIFVDDGTGLSDSETISINVLEVNQPPVLNAIGNKTTMAGDLITFTATATDPDTPANGLTFSLDATAPAGASINPTTGVFTWTPAQTLGGTTADITVRVTDNGNPALNDFEKITITVEACVFDDALTDWTVNETGGSTTGRGTVTAQDCIATLTEGDSFTTTLSTSFVVPSNPTSLSFTYANLNFDKTDTSSINDAFEVALVDQAGDSLVPTYLSNRDAFFNATEDLPVAKGTGVAINGSTVTLDLTGVLAGSQATLIFRLANNDSDELTSVRITDLQLDPNTPLSAPAAAISGSTTLSAKFQRTAFSGNASTQRFPAAGSESHLLTPAVTGSTVGEDGKVIFDTTEDFSRGSLQNLNTSAVPNQLSVNAAADLETLPFIWISNSAEGTVSRLDTRTGREIGRYRVGPGGDNPSRIAVTQEGDAWVANREGTQTAVKLLLDGFIDRNSNEVMDTSRDANNDGKISLDEMLPWDANADGLPDDERVAFVVSVGGGPRGVAVDANNKVWVAGSGATGFKVFDNETGELETTVATPYGSYGAVIDADGNLWSAIGAGNAEVMRIDTNTRTFVETIRVASAYGITVDRDGIVWTSPNTGRQLSRYNPATKELNVYDVPETSGGGITVDRQGNVWFGSHYSDRIWKFTFAEDRKTLISSESVQVGPQPKSASIDADGYLWTVCLGNNMAYKIDTTTNTIVPGWPVPTGAGPYNYSDMTGDRLQTVTQRSGTWTEIVDSGRLSAAWAGVEIDADLPAQSKLQLRVRSSNDRDSLSQRAWQVVLPNQPLPAIAGQFLEVETRLTSNAPDVHPAIDSVAVASVPQPAVTIDQPLSGSRTIGTALVSGRAVAQRPVVGSSRVLNEILYVTINGKPVDQLDSVGNYFATVDVLAGVNTFEVTGHDRFGQSTTEFVTVEGKAIGSIDLSRFADTTGSFTGVYGRTSFEADTNKLYVDLATRNDGTFSSDVPLLVGVRNISDPRVSVVGADGSLADGTPYFDFTQFVTGGKLAPGQQSASPTISFHNPLRGQFDYDLVFLGKLNDPPEITTVPKIEAISGKTYSYDVNAIDQNSDTLTYSLLQSPSGMQIDPASGLITWTTTAANIGQHDVVIQVSDGRGGTAIQRYVMSVVVAPPNRPPVITSTPVTSAHLSGLSRQPTPFTPIELVPSDVNSTLEANFSTLPTANPALFGFTGTNIRKINLDTTPDGLSIPSGIQLDEVYAQEGVVFVNVPTSNSVYGGPASAPNASYIGSGVSEIRFTVPVIAVGLINTSPDGDFLEYYSPEGDRIFATQDQLGRSPNPDIDQFVGARSNEGQLIGSVRIVNNIGNLELDELIFEVASESIVSRYEYDVAALDPDGDDLVFSLGEAPTGMRIDPASGLIVWLSSVDQVGDHQVKVVVDDGHGGIATQEFTVCVHPVEGNHSPVIVTEPVVTLTPSASTANGVADYSYNVDAVDPDSDTLTYSLTQSPAGMTIESSTGVITWPSSSILPADVSAKILTGPIHNPANGHDYYLLVPSLWTDAESDAVKLGGHLATVRNLAENDWIYSTFSKFGGVDRGLWIGLNDRDTEGVFRWSSGETPTYLNWGGGEPATQSGTDDFVHLFWPGESRQSTWNDIWDEGFGGAPGHYFSVPISAVVEVVNGAQVKVRVTDGRGGADEQSFSVKREAAGGEIRGTVLDSVEAPVNLVRNGDFELGDADFRTDLVDGSPGSSGTYRIAKDPFPVYGPFNPAVGSFGDHTSGTGQMFMVNGSEDPGFVNWEEVVSVTPNTEYTFSTWAATFYDVAPAHLRFAINGVDVGDTLHLPAVEGEWQQFYTTWNSGIATTATIQIRNDTTAFIGNDFVLDAIQFRVGTPLDSWTVYLDQNADGVHDDSERSTITDANGDYAFAGLVEGTYIVREDSRTGWQQTFPIAINSVELIRNGSFEVGTPSIGFGIVVHPGDHDIQAWDVTANSVDYIGTLWAASDGVRSLDMTGTPGAGTVSQTISTVPGQSYTLTFDLGGNASGAPALKQLRVAAAGMSQEYEFDVSTETPWKHEAFGFTASSTSTIVSFSSLIDGLFGPTIDNVSVKQTLAPGAHVVTLANGQVVSGIDFGNTFTGDAANGKPVFSSTAVTTGVRGQLYRYDAKATDPNNDPLTYGIVSGPEGITVHPTLGAVVWIPTKEQVGSHSVVISVRDDKGEVALQQFTIEVLQSNSAPSITSTAPVNGAVGTAFVYEVRGQDADGDTLAFALDTKPTGMEIDPVTRRITWTPTAAQTGNQNVVVAIGDGRGGRSTQAFTVAVSAAGTNSVPVFTSTPRTRAFAGQLYGYAPTATDINGDGLTYSLESGPTGLILNSDNLLTWTPTFEQAATGTHSVTVKVVDGKGGEATQTFSISVGTEIINDPPVITSNPRLVAIENQTYVYDLKALDADADPLLWSLELGPAGMSIDPVLGTLRWTPQEDQLGQNTVVVTVSDLALQKSTQRFVIDTRCSNLAPAILSIPLTSALAGRNYIYAVRAVDAEQDLLMYDLTSKPEGMSINPVTGVIRWTPLTSQIGLHDIVITATDSAGAVGRQSYKIKVGSPTDKLDPNDPNSPPIGNRPPVITSTPVFSAEVDAVYEYAVTAIDPDGDDISFAAEQMPEGMHIDPVTGVIRWTPTAAQAGEYTLIITVKDSNNAVASQGFVLVAAVNQPPVINSSPVTTATSGAQYRYSVKATDPEGDALSYRLDAAPEGMSIDRFGRILWHSTVATTAAQAVTVRVSDSRGKSVTQSFTITMVADTEVPKVSLLIRSGNFTFTGNGQVNVNTSYTVTVLATDNVGVAEVGLLVDGQRVVLNAANSITLTASQFGNVQLQGMAKDTTGLEGTADATVAVVDSANTNRPVPNTPGLPPHPGFKDGDNGRPIVTITSPEMSATVTNRTTIIGTVDDPENNLWYYRVYTARLDRVSVTDFDFSDTDWMILNTGTQEVIDGQLGIFDATSLSNDPFVIAVAAFDVNALGWIGATIVNVEGNVQVGNFRLDFADLSIPLVGIPIQVTRVYDTFASQDQGDFGYGWSLGVQDARILEVGNLSTGGAFTPGDDKFVPGRSKVYLTNPEGKRVGFTYQERPISIGWFGGTWEPYFVPDSGVTDKLSIDETQVGRGGIVGALLQGINPEFYTLTTKNGLKYRYSDKAGLQTISDTNGNQVKFTDEGIFHSAGPSVRYVRDNKGRIKEILDPANNAIQYQYDLKGDLVKVIDRVFANTEFLYLSNPAHYLDTYIDSLGRKAAKNEYDANGKLIATITSDGKRITFDHNLDARSEVIYDLMGHPTTYFYDNRGNITRLVNAVGDVTQYTYDSNNNKLTETNGEGETVTMAYDSGGNMLSRTDNLGNVTRYSYESNRVTTVVDPKGGIYAFTYDEKGNVLTDSDANGNTRYFTYFPNGRVKSSSDRMGNVIAFEYDSRGNVTVEIDPMGHRAEFTYDLLGNLTSTTRTRTDENGDLKTLTTTTEYDDGGRVTLVRDVMGNESSFVYRADGLVAEESDIRGIRAVHQYDARGNRSHTDYSDGSSETSTYDANGNVVMRRDRNGAITQNEYDDANRVKMTIDQYGKKTLIDYDMAGRQKTIDSAGVTAKLSHDGGQVFSVMPGGDSPLSERPRISRVDIEGADYVIGLDYDANGNITGVSSSDGKQFGTVFTGTNIPSTFSSGGKTSGQYVLDENGNPKQVTDQNGVRYSYVRDAAGRITEVADPLGNKTKFTYDELGNKIAQTDAENKTTRWQYDDAGHVTKRILPGGQLESFQYDSVGNLRIHINFNGERTEYEYDPQGRVKKKFSVSDGRVFQFTYDNSGRLRQVEDRRGIATFAYDSFGRTHRIVNPDQSFIEYGYDERGNRRTITTRSGAIVYTYDTLNRLATVTDIDGSVIRYSYNMNARSTTIAMPNGTQSTYVLDTMDRPVSIVHRDPTGAPFAKYDVTYETAEKSERTIRELNGRVVVYTYDALHRLVRESIVDPANGNETIIYSYDKVGNRLTKTNSEGTVLYTYDENHRLQTAGGATYSYDGNGNVRRIEESNGATEYTFNSDNQLVNVVLPSGTHIDYEYNHVGIRVSETLNGQKTVFLIDNEAAVSRVIESQDVSSAVNKRFLYGDRLLAEINMQQSFPFYTDPLGSVRFVAGPDGAVVGGSDFDAFGVRLDPGIGSEYGFQSEPTDSESNLTYLRARYYASETGRFLSIDPLQGSVEDPRSINPYSYANSDPTSFTDPTGKFAILSIGLIVQLAAGFGALGGFAGSTFGVVASVLSGSRPTHSLRSTAINVSAPIVGGLSFSSEFLKPLDGMGPELEYVSYGIYKSFSFGSLAFRGYSSSVSKTTGTVFGVNDPADYAGGFSEGSLSILGIVFIDNAVSSSQPFKFDVGALSIATGFVLPPAGLEIAYSWRTYRQVGM